MHESDSASETLRLFFRSSDCSLKSPLRIAQCTKHTTGGRSRSWGPRLLQYLEYLKSAFSKNTSINTSPNHCYYSRYHLFCVYRHYRSYQRGLRPRRLSPAPPKNKSEGFALASLLHLQIIIRLQTIKIGSVQYMLKTIELLDIFFRQFVLKW